LHEVIELGGGTNPLYHPNLDILPVPLVDIPCDLAQGIPLESHSVKKIFSRDFIEHINFAQFLFLLSECARVLVKDGTIEFIVPDMAGVIRNNSEWNIFVNNIVVGRWTPHTRKHQAWYSVSLMSYILRKQGWSSWIRRDNLGEDGYKEPKFRVGARYIWLGLPS